LGYRHDLAMQRCALGSAFAEASFYSAAHFSEIPPVLFWPGIGSVKLKAAVD